MLSEKLKGYIHARYAPEGAGEEALLLTLAEKTLPASDAALVPREVLLSYVRHGLLLRQQSPYCRQVPEDIFLHYVFYPRVNSEALVDCRPFFHERLAPVVAGLSDVEAALAVNRWCAAQMTYESTDERTIDPLTAYHCGLGRCGEESVFAVTAFRSVGIPARQVYVPWWSHCDDNHAWVEVYVAGDWHFLGACEPEPILDRGWFTSAATRAMVVISRSFFDYGLEAEPVIGREGCCRHHNQISRYADTASITVRALPGAKLRFGVLNMAELAVIAELEADEAGLVSLETGRGSLLIEGRRGEVYAFCHLRTDLEEVCTLDFHRELPRGAWDVDFTAPAAGTKNRTTLTSAQQAEKMAVLTDARNRRLARIGSYFLPEYEAAPADMQDILRRAGGNAPALWVFYQKNPEKALPLLKTLAPKDYRDAKPAVLQAHLDTPMGPRIGFEVLTAWQQPLLEAMGARQAEFRAEPGRLREWIWECFPNRGYFFYDPLWLPPLAALRLGAADERGRELLYVAARRCLGLPAVWGRDAAPEVELRVETALPYFRSWSLARWQDGWQTLELTDGEPAYGLPRGLYRLITVNRLPNGNQLAHMRVFDLEKDEALSLPLRQAGPRQMLAQYPVPLVPCGLELRLYLEPGAEPTEHALNELLEAKQPSVPVRLVIGTREQGKDPTLQRVLQSVPGVHLEVADFTDGALEALARALYLEPGVWPLLVLTDGQTGYYGHCGYGVNTVPLALGLARYV